MASPFLIWMRKQPLRSVSNPTDSWAILFSRFAAKSSGPGRAEARPYRFVSSKSSLPINILRISDVPPPIS